MDEYLPASQLSQEVWKFASAVNVPALHAAHTESLAEAAHPEDLYVPALHEEQLAQTLSTSPAQAVPANWSLLHAVHCLHSGCRFAWLQLEIANWSLGQARQLMQASGDAAP